MKEVSKNIQNTIASIGSPKKAQWLENYVKHNIKSKGVGIPEIRNIIRKINEKYKLTDKTVTEQIELLNDLMSQEYTEDKIAAILYLQLFWKGKNEPQTFDLISYWFDNNFITDWNVCDWLCVRILTPLLDNYTKKTIAELRKWNRSENLWKARASLVPFAQSNSIKKHEKLIKELSSKLIKRDERFCKTAVGWVLREYSKVDKEFVEKFLSDNENYTTKEVIKNATKYL